MRARKPRVIIIYNGKDVSSDLTPYLEQVNYTDRVIGESDEISITLDNTDGKWGAEWYPTKGDKIRLKMGWDDLLVDCGEFTIDELELSGPPSIVQLKGIATWVTSAMRTRASKAHETKTLKQIVQAYAAKHGLTHVGTIETIQIARETQHQETDLQFLKRLADEYGFSFGIRGKQLVFDSIYKMEDGLPVMELDLESFKQYSFRDKTEGTYKKASVKYQNPKDGKVVSATVNRVENKDGVAFNEIASADELVVHSKAENPGQAQAKAKAALHKANSKQQTGNVSLEGEPLLVAGNPFTLNNAGSFSGKWFIEVATHTFTKGEGYTTSLEIKRIKKAEGGKGATKKAKGTATTKGTVLTAKTAAFKNADGVGFTTIQE